MKLRNVEIDEGRFWAKVDRLDETSCWPWLAGKRNGYGIFALAKRVHAPAHRVAYTLLVGPIPDGCVIDHLCRNPACVNPSHLDAVSQGTNVLRGDSPVAAHARQATCHRGHPLDGILRTGARAGKRYCRACNAERMRIARAAA